MYYYWIVLVLIFGIKQSSYDEVVEFKTLHGWLHTYILFVSKFVVSHPYPVIDNYLPPAYEDGTPIAVKLDNYTLKLLLT